MFFTKGQVLEAYRRFAKIMERDVTQLDGALKKIYPTMDGAYVILPSNEDDSYSVVSVSHTGSAFCVRSGLSIEQAKQHAFKSHVEVNHRFQNQLENMLSNLEDYLRPTQVEKTEQFDEVSEEVTCASY